MKHRNGFVWTARDTTSTGFSSMRWYCFRTQNKREKQTCVNIIRELGVDTFCPMISRIRQTRIGKKRFTEAMFPCYAFARIDLEVHLRDLRHTRGVQKILQIGDSVPHVPDRFVVDLRDGLNDSDTLIVGEILPQVDQLVEIKSGPFRNLYGKIARSTDGNGRIAILLDFLGRQVAVRVQVDTISIV